MPRVREEVRGVRLDIRMLFFWLSRGPRRKSIRDASVKIIAMEALRRAQERMWRHLKAFFLLVVLAKPIKRRQLRLLSEGLSGAQRNASEGLHFRGSIAPSITEMMLHVRTSSWRRLRYGCRSRRNLR